MYHGSSERPASCLRFEQVSEFHLSYHVYYRGNDVHTRKWFSPKYIYIGINRPI